MASKVLWSPTNGAASGKNGILTPARFFGNQFCPNNDTYFGRGHYAPRT